MADTDTELADVGIERFGTENMLFDMEEVLVDVEEDVLSNTEFELDDIVNMINADLAESSDAGKEWYMV